MTDITQQIYEMIEANVPEAQRPNMILPPPVITELQGKFIEFDEDAQKLVAQFPVQYKHLQPLKFLQGGIVAALLDSTIGPLSFLVAPPNVTTQFNISYIRPTTMEAEIVTVTAQVQERTRRQLFIDGVATNPEGKTLAIVRATHQILE